MLKCRKNQIYRRFNEIVNNVYENNLTRINFRIKANISVRASFKA